MQCERNKTNAKELVCLEMAKCCALNDNAMDMEHNDESVGDVLRPNKKSSVKRSQMEIKNDHRTTKRWDEN